MLAAFSVILIALSSSLNSSGESSIIAAIGAIGLFWNISVGGIHIYRPSVSPIIFRKGSIIGCNVSDVCTLLLSDENSS